MRLKWQSCKPAHTAHSLLIIPILFTDGITRMRKMDMVTLIVGPEKVRIQAHKYLLAFYSKFFEAALFGGFREASTSEIELQEDNEKDIRAFVLWTYTGDVRASHRNLQHIKFGLKVSVRLWALGDKIMAPRFCNELMQGIFFFSNHHVMRAPYAEYIYALTGENSKLREYVIAVIVHEGDAKNSARDSDWMVLLAKGGDLAVDMVLAGAFTYGCEACEAQDQKSPWGAKIRSKYLEDCSGPSAEDWIWGK